MPTKLGKLTTTMPNLDLSILVVDDAKFSSAIINKTLRNAGYQDVRIATNAATAMQMLEKRQVSVLLADWLMPEMDGLEMTEHVRQLDEATNHFTYIILLTAKEGVEALAEAFDRGVDDFIYKSQMNRQLLPRIYAADRIADMQNSLLVANQLLLDNNRDLQESNLLDLTTGLGNQKMARTSLQSMLRQTESRGSVTNYLLLGINNWSTIRSQFKPIILDEVATGIARRLRHLTRPIDTLCRISENQFAIISQFNHIEQCTISCFRRITDGINLKAFKTTAGFISVKAGSSVCAIDGSTTLPKPQQIEQLALRKLQYAYETGTVSINRWPEMSAELAEMDRS
jgi:phosphoserine phosphatase RsbU/P